MSEAAVPTERMTIHQRLIAILAELPPIGKSQRNEQQDFMFRGQDDVLNALNPLLAKHGVVIIPDVIERVTAQRTTSNNKVMFEINLHVRFTFYGADGDSVTGSSWGEGTDMGDKATNKAMTMAFKYVLNEVFAISTSETVDADSHTPEDTTVQEDPLVKILDFSTSLEALSSLVGICEKLDEELPRDGGWYPICKRAARRDYGKPVSELNDAEAEELFNKFEQQLPEFQEAPKKAEASPDPEPAGVAQGEAGAEEDGIPY